MSADGVMPDLVFGLPASADGGMLFGDTGPDSTLSSSDLVFEFAAATNGSLLFGYTGGSAPGTDVSVSIAGSFAPLSADVKLTRLRTAVVSGSFGALTASISVGYSTNTQRPTVAAIGVTLQHAEEALSGVECSMSDGHHASVGWAAHQQQATHLLHGVQHQLPGRLQPDRHATPTSLQDGRRLTAGRDAALQDAKRSVRLLLATAVENAAAERAETAFRLQDGDHSKRTSRSALIQEARPHRVPHTSSGGGAAHLNRYWLAVFQDGVPPPAGVSKLPVPPVLPGGCYTPSAHLLFSFPAVIGGDLLFQCGDYSPAPEPGGTIVVPVRRFYMVVNSVSLFAMPSGVELSALAFGMTLDADSWTWSVQATLDKAAEPHVRRGDGDPPVELQAFVNGVPYRFMVDSVGRSKQFPVERVQIKGRGLAAELADPWCPQLSFGNLVDRTAQQLTSDVLTNNGVAIGWAVDWGIEDWLVTGGAWQFQGTYIDAVKDIAESVGAYVQPHPTDRTLRVIPRYPVAPWHWGTVTPDIVLPASAVQVEDTQWINKPDYNGVWVGGISAGVFGPVTRNGTSGSLLAPQVRHALITDHVAHRQRGVAVLADTGRQADVQLTLQVLPETGIITPGLMVEYVGDDGPALGIVRSTAVNWARPKLRQTIALETHDA